MNKTSSLLVAALAVLTACSAGKPVEPSDETATVTIMTFNVQNLFDNVDDPGTDDKAYLPIAAKENDEHIAACSEIDVDSWRNECLSLDWSDEILDTKFRAVASAIRQIDGGPDVIAFQEVEKAAVLDRLANEYLTEFGYSAAILVEGQDARGIDVGFLSRLPLVEAPVLHPLTFEQFPERQADTRGVLEATFELPDGSLITGFAVHFPAPFHPTAMRIAAYRQLAKLRDALPDNHHAFAAGDFNTTSTEVEKTGLLERLARPHWTVAHETALASGCVRCRGTYYYARDDNWSFLDMILWSPARGENATWQIRAESAWVVNRLDAQITANDTPARFDAAAKTGVSDHWPLAVMIEPTEKQ